MGGGVRLSLSSQPNPTLSSPSLPLLLVDSDLGDLIGGFTIVCRAGAASSLHLGQQTFHGSLRKFSREWKKLLIFYIANAEKLNSWSMCATAIIIIVSIVLKISPHGWTRSQQVLPRRVPQSWSRSPANPSFISSDSMVLKNAPASTCWPGIALRVPLPSIHWIPLPDFKFV